MTPETPSSTPSVRVEALAAEFSAAAAHWAGRLGLPLDGEADFALQLGAAGLQLVDLAPGAPGPVRVDFVSGAAAHRRQFGGGAGQMLARAVGLKPGIRPNVLDATAGLGRDAFVLASLGCPVTLIERQAIVAALLEDGLARAAAAPEVAPIAARLKLDAGDAIGLMRDWVGEAPQVVYLDPMFPEREKSALVKKEMRIFRAFVGGDADTADLLAAALALATHRVVVKRPRRAPPIDGPAPSHALTGESSRFDVYARRSLVASLG